MVTSGYRQFPVNGVAKPAATEANAFCQCGDYGCSSPGKHPVFGGWQEAATTDPEQILAWAEQHPGCNFGTPLGDGIYVIEYDPYQVNGHRLKSLRDSGIPTSALSTSGRGLHDYIAGTARNGQKIFPGATARSDGYFVVSPGSLHFTGRRYGRRNTLVARSELPVYDLPRIEPEYTVEQREILPDLVPAGDRHETLKRHAGRLRRTGLNEGAIAASLRALRDEQFDDSGREVGDDEINSLARWIMRFEPEDDALFDVGQEPATDGEEAEDEGLIILSNTVAQGRSWAYSDLIPLGVVTTLVGKQGQGKTTFAKTVGAELTKGTLPGDLLGQPSSVLISSFEEDCNSDVLPSVRYAGGDLDLIGFIPPRNDEPHKIAAWLDENVEEMEDESGTRVRLIVLDGGKDFCRGNRPDWDNAESEVKRYLRVLDRLAARREVAIVMILHPNRSGGGQTAGSVAWESKPRQCLEFMRGIVEVHKSNFGRMGRFITVTGENRFEQIDGKEHSVWRQRLPHHVAGPPGGSEVWVGSPIVSPKALPSGESDPPPKSEARPKVAGPQWSSIWEAVGRAEHARGRSARGTRPDTANPTASRSGIVRIVDDEVEEA